MGQYGHVSVIEHLPAVTKPRLRGRLHQVAAYVALPAGLVLLLGADGARARLAAGVYIVTMVLLYGISSSYHVHEWAPQVPMRWRRGDRAMIYVLIARSYTP